MIRTRVVVLCLAGVCVALLIAAGTASSAVQSPHRSSNSLGHDWTAPRVVGTGGMSTVLGSDGVLRGQLCARSCTGARTAGWQTVEMTRRGVSKQPTSVVWPGGALGVEPLPGGRTLVIEFGRADVLSATGRLLRVLHTHFGNDSADWGDTYGQPVNGGPENSDGFTELPNGTVIACSGTKVLVIPPTAKSFRVLTGPNIPGSLGCEVATGGSDKAAIAFDGGNSGGWELSWLDDGNRLQPPVSVPTGERTDGTTLGISSTGWVAFQWGGRGSEELMWVSPAGTHSKAIHVDKGASESSEPRLAVVGTGTALSIATVHKHLVAETIQTDGSASKTPLASKVGGPNLYQAGQDVYLTDGTAADGTVVFERVRGTWKKVALLPGNSYLGITGSQFDGLSVDANGGAALITNVVHHPSSDNGPLTYAFRRY